MITVMLENVCADDVFVEVIDANQATHPTVFRARLNAGEIEKCEVQEDDDDYANLTWNAKPLDGSALTVRSMQPGPGDTVEISL